MLSNGIPRESFSNKLVDFDSTGLVSLLDDLDSDEDDGG